MKKFFVLALAGSMIAGAVQAQEAFKHLGMSLEAGSTGFGVNLSYPLVTDHLVLTLGYNFPALTIKKTADLNPSYVNGKIGNINQMIDRYNTNVQKFNEQVEPMAQYGVALDPMTPIANKIENLSAMSGNIEAKLNFANYKAFLEYYPTTKSYFHFTVGFMAGNGEWMNISAEIDRNTWGTYQQAIAAGDLAMNTVQNYNSKLPTYNAQIDAANALIDQHNQLPGAEQIARIQQLPEVNESAPIDDAAAVSINGQTFVIGRDSNGRLDMTMKIKKIKPYLGVGFGSSVPTKHRCGFQMEVGAYYQSTPTLESLQENPSFAGNTYTDKTIDEIVKTIVHLQWYPQLTLRWTGRLF